MHKTQGPQGLQGVDPEPEGLPPVYNFIIISNTQRKELFCSKVSDKMCRKAEN